MERWLAIFHLISPKNLISYYNGVRPSPLTASTFAPFLINELRISSLKSVNQKICSIIDKNDFLGVSNESLGANLLVNLLCCRVMA